MIGVPSAASATWSGYWTYAYTPPPPRWYWTWVWVVPGGSLVVDPPSEIIVYDFWTLDPEDVTFSGLLKTDFVIDKTAANSDDLILLYTGTDALTVGENLGTITLVDPDVTPLDVQTVTLDYTASFDTTSGFVQGSGTISSAIPEPASWALMIVGFGGLGAIGYSRRTPVGNA